MGGMAEWSKAPVLKTGRPNVRKSSQLLANSQVSGIGDDEASARLALCLAQTVEKWPDLTAVIETWPDLPEAVRTGIVAMVKAGRE